RHYQNSSADHRMGQPCKPSKMAVHHVGHWLDFSSQAVNLKAARFSQSYVNSLGRKPWQLPLQVASVTSIRDGNPQHMLNVTHNGSFSIVNSAELPKIVLKLSYSEQLGRRATRAPS